MTLLILNNEQNTNCKERFLKINLPMRTIDALLNVKQQNNSVSTKQ